MRYIVITLIAMLVCIVFMLGSHSHLAGRLFQALMVIVTVLLIWVQRDDIRELIKDFKNPSNNQ